MARKDSGRFVFCVPSHWRSPVFRNPFAVDAQKAVLKWMASLGCTASELERASRFDIAGYVGIPFPTLNLPETVQIGKYLSLWLLWDDIHVENLENRWRIRAQDVLNDAPPAGMSRFDQGWWDLMKEFSTDRSPIWLDTLCEAMATWCQAAVEEAIASNRSREEDVFPSFERHLALRIATIGMYPTFYLFEEAYDYELPKSFHTNPVVRQLKLLAGKIVGLGNDILSFGKDCAEGQLNLVSTLMREKHLSADQALEQLIHVHNDAVLEYDQLANSLSSVSEEVDLWVHRWLQDVRYACVGFSIWESQAPRYTSHKIVVNDEVIQPQFAFMGFKPGT